MQVLVIGKISSAVVLAGAAYQDEAGYARMTGLPREKTRLLDDKGRTDTQVCPGHHFVLEDIVQAESTSVLLQPVGMRRPCPFSCCDVREGPKPHLIG